MEKRRRFTGTHITVIIVVAVLAAAIGTPVTVLAATGNSFRIVDRSHPDRAAAVSRAGALKVAVAGTSHVSVMLPAKSFSFTTYAANQLISTDLAGRNMRFPALPL